MDNEIVLSAKELYYLGKLMQARYIDYSYIAAMDDVGKIIPFLNPNRKNHFPIRAVSKKILQAKRK